MNATLALARPAQTEAEALAQDQAEAIALAHALLLEALDSGDTERARYLAERIAERR